MATSLITFSLIGDGVLFIAVTAGRRRGDNSDAAFFLRLTSEHVALAALLSLPVFIAVHPPQDRTFREFAVVAATTIVVALYNSAVFFCTATFRNRAVAIMALWNGLLYFSVPIAFHAQHAPLNIAPFFCFLLSLVPAIAILAPHIRLTTRDWRETLKGVTRFGRVVSIREVMLLSTGRAFKMLSLWGPVLFLGGHGDLQSANNYRITLSLMEGAGGLVPYPRNSMLSLLREEHFRGSATAARAIHFSLFVAAVGSLGLLAFGDLVVSHVFNSEFAGVRLMLRDGFLYLPLMIVAMMLANSLAAEEKIVPLAISYVLSASIGIAVLLLTTNAIAALMSAFLTLVALLWLHSSPVTRRMFVRALTVIGGFSIACAGSLLASGTALRVIILIVYAGSFFFVDSLGRELLDRVRPRSELFQSRARRIRDSLKRRDAS